MSKKESLTDKLSKKIIENIVVRQKQNEEEFKSLDLDSTIFDIYNKSLQKAKDDYLNEVRKELSNIRKTSLTDDQTQARINNYVGSIQNIFLDDYCIYRLKRNEVESETNNFKIGTEIEQKEKIIDKISDHIVNDILSFENKLYFIKQLPQQIYHSNKIHKQFLLFKNNQLFYDKSKDEYFFKSKVSKEQDKIEENPKNSFCTSKEFKTDISELCLECPLTNLINEGITNQIIFQAEQQKEILNENQFKNYIEDEISNAQERMQELFLTESQNKNYKNDPHRKKRIQNYILNKERIKALNHLSKVKKEDFLITKQSITYFKLTKNYKVTEKEKSRIYRQLGKENTQKHFDNKKPDINCNYKITFNKKVDREINFALKRDYKILNSSNKNYRFEFFDYLGKIEIFKISDVEYLIESSKNDKEEISISIYNYEFYKKHIEFLNGLLANFNFGVLKGLKEDIIEDALSKNIRNIDEFANDIEKVFNHCLDFHNNENFERVDKIKNKYELFGYLPNAIFFWKSKKEDELNSSIGNLLTRLEDLFISTNPSTFMQIRDLIILWIEKTIKITINNEKKMFEWAYSPFMETIFNLNKKIVKLFSDNRIILKSNLQNSNNEAQISNKKNQTLKPTLKEIALKFTYLNKPITRQNSKSIALENGHTSGDALYNKFTFYYSTANRKGKPHPYTEKRLKNKISLFKNVIKMLEKPNKDKALDELKILENYYKNDFEI